MGYASHKKKIPLGRGSKTRGVGITYTDPTQPHAKELTAEEVAIKEQQRAAQES